MTALTGDNARPRRRRHRTPLVHAQKKVVAEVRSEINVTPLVDVCLVLLIIFMVVAPMLSRGKDAELPKASHSRAKNDAGSQPIVSVVKGPGGRVEVYFDRDLMPDLETLKKRIQEEVAKLKEPVAIFVKADANLSFGEVYPTLMAIHDSGAPGVELGTTCIKGAPCDQKEK